MKILRKTVALLLGIIFTVFAFNFTSCKKQEDKSDILIISKETFDSKIVLNEQGNIAEPFSIKKLADSEVEYLQDGMEYCALIYIRKEYVYKGEISFGSEAIPHLTLGKCYSMNSGESGISLSINSVGNGYELKNNDKKISKSTHYAAFSFTFNGFEVKEELFDDILDINLRVITSDSKFASYIDINKSVRMRHEKQIKASSTVKFLSLSEYQSGKIGDSLKETLEAPVFEKFYAVIDYTLTGGTKIEESDTASVLISAKGEGVTLRLEAEELPTGDYTSEGNSVKANVKIHGGGAEGKKFRFIISVFVESCATDCEVEVSAGFSAGNISFTGENQAKGIAKINKSLSPATKMDFTLSDDGTYYILSGLGTDTGNVINVPGRYNELRVKEIGKDAFKNYTHIKEVKVSSSVEKISESAFEGSEGFKIIIPKNVTFVGDNAFAGCTDAEIYVEHETRPYNWSTSWVDDKAYTMWGYGDSRFELHFDQSSYCFNYKGFNSVNVAVPEKYNGLPVTQISSNAFDGCTNLKKIKLPATISSVYGPAFKSCSLLETIVLDEKNTVYKCIGGCFISVETGEIVFGTKNAVIPTDGSVKSIGESAFYARKDLTFITIPDCIETIGARAFYSCAQLEEIILGENTRLKSIGKDAFYRCGYYLDGKNWSSGTAYEGLLYIGKALICGGSLSGEISIKDGTVCIADKAFYDLEITGIIFPSSLFSIGENAFSYCKQLKTLTVPASVKQIRNYAFCGCEALETLVISEGITEIGQNAFSGCTSLKTVILPLSLNKIDYRAFCNCTSLSSIKYAPS